MEKKRKLQLAAEMLKNSRGYVNGDSTVFSNFDYAVDNESDRILVFNTEEGGAFFWGSICNDITNSLRMAYYISVRDGICGIKFEKPRAVCTIFAK